MTGSFRLHLAIVASSALWLSAVALVAHEQGVSPAAGKKAGEAFRNVTTSTLKELSVDDFVASMGLISANLGLDCADCHPNAGTDKADFVIDTPRKITTRRMVEMVATINRTTFAGVQRVTCWTCHHGRITPATTISLDDSAGKITPILGTRCCCADATPAAASVAANPITKSRRSILRLPAGAMLAPDETVGN